MKIEGSKKIDFVIIWVDEHDEEWRKEKNKFSEGDYNNENNVRFRDWDNLKYFFRGVEKFAPWVNKVHFVTCGHLPDFLNVAHEKLNIVKHSDFINPQNLPTFSSHTIELNLYKIKGLQEQFVYFNDDMFIIDYVKPNDFFEKGKPKDSAILNIVRPDYKGITNIVENDLMIINKYFSLRRTLKDGMFKWFNIKYGFNVIRTLVLMMWNCFMGFWEVHLPNAYLKSTFEEIWDKESVILEKTCSNRFRSPQDCNQWLARYWQLASNNFIPRESKFGKMISVLQVDDIIEAIIKQKYKLICINDSEELVDIEGCKNMINNAFDTILSEKSSYEI